MGGSTNSTVLGSGRRPQASWNEAIPPPFRNAAKQQSWKKQVGQGGRWFDDGAGGVVTRARTLSTPTMAPVEMKVQQPSCAARLVDAAGQDHS
eukprot:5917367-Prymnesium_polylepis.1